MSRKCYNSLSSVLGKSSKSCSISTTGTVASKTSKASKLSKVSNASSKSRCDEVPIVTINQPKNLCFRASQIKVQKASREHELAHQLRMVVREGRSADPSKNPKLRFVIKRALESRMPESAINCVLNGCEKTKDFMKSHLLQIRFQRRIFLICTVQAANIEKLRAKVMILLKKCSAGFVFALHMFHNAGLVEAMVSYRTVLDFHHLEYSLALDVIACNATGVEILNYETGAVQFKCDPLKLCEVCQAVESKGYQVLYTEYELRAKKLVDINSIERREYSKFLSQLVKFPEIDNIFDNIKPDRNDEMGDS